MNNIAPCTPALSCNFSGKILNLHPQTSPRKCEWLCMRLLMIHYLKVEVGDNLKFVIFITFIGNSAIALVARWIRLNNPMSFFYFPYEICSFTHVFHSKLIHKIRKDYINELIFLSFTRLVKRADTSFCNMPVCLHMSVCWDVLASTTLKIFSISWKIKIVTLI